VQERRIISIDTVRQRKYTLLPNSPTPRVTMHHGNVGTAQVLRPSDAYSQTLRSAVTRVRPWLHVK